MSRRVGLARMATMVLLTVALLDVASRLVSLDVFAFRAYEVVSHYPAPGAPFEAGLAYDNPRSSGDLAGIGNLPDLREHRPERFTTDSRGFRNPALERGAWEGLLFGSSFSAGSGVDDGQTLSSQLAAISGLELYNTAPYPPNLDRVDQLIRELDIRGGFAVFEHYESGTGAPELYSLPAPRRLNELCARVLGFVGLDRSCADLHVTSPLQISVQRILRAVQDDRVLPNPMRRNVIEARLPDGRSTLMLPGWIDEAASRARLAASSISRQADAYARWRDVLAERGIRTIVLLVPTKYTVYGPLSDDVPAPQQDGYLQLLAAQLRARDIEFVDMTERFRSAAREGIAAGTTIYWRDDTHWNVEGIGLAARELALAVRRLEP